MTLRKWMSNDLDAKKLKKIEKPINPNQPQGHINH